MADKSTKNPGSVAGPWYVDASCIGCSLCTTTAPATFAMSDDGSVAVVIKQPGEADELELAAQAMTDCPVGAIGNDA